MKSRLKGGRSFKEKKKVVSHVRQGRHCNQVIYIGKRIGRILL